MMDAFTRWAAFVGGLLLLLVAPTFESLPRLASPADHAAAAALAVALGLGFIVTGNFLVAWAIFCRD